ncbi:hypothetical protein AB4262_10705 [Vibrio breoganii]
MNEKIYQSAPESAIPKPGTNAYKYLSMIAESSVISERALMEAFEGRQRGALQQLGNETNEYWLIHNVVSLTTGRIFARYLDERHLSGNRDYDAQARLERKKMLKTVSYIQAVNEAGRVPKARKELIAVKEESAQQ